MNVDVLAGGTDELALYTTISIAYRVDEVVDVDALVARGGRRVESHRTARGYVKDYDRVDPRLRRRGVGSLVLAEIERWALRRGIRVLVAETQDVNVPACRFYAAHGFQLDSVAPGAYDGLPDEVRILWSKGLESL